ncbi:exostosin-like 1 isoform X2 [Ammospiza nelsoni]|uniref:exostosin-like 1 isoform X2 n=1 Tax=Ammospiza nelsoni TaxID=2857394 RepID=UPI00286A98F9|nr:exostosin-like 1 isoform X2 [Ammospiza nelsoni]
MQTRKKYIFLAFLASWLLLFLFGGDQLRRFALFSVRKAESPRSWPRWTDRSLLRSFAEPEELQRDGDPALLSPRARRAAWLSAHRSSRCRMESCFDLSRCERNGFKVFTYPQERGQPVSETYSKILSSIERSRYHTARPEEACLFILSADTLDRDRLSEHYVRDLEGKIHGSPLWNGGRNHLIFNLYSGTWPGYGGELGFDPGHAILARASSDSRTFRPGFDVSIPLIPREHPQRGGRRGRLAEVPPKRRFLLAFKGKRYLTGIGSGTRNALHHIHNGKDIISLTTCKHGKDWHRHKDTRCDKDNVDYERFDYQELLHNSTFCIVPRGRRLGSFRFLEALQIPSAVRCIRPERVLAFQQQTQFLWDAYFSSVDKIVHTTLEIIRDRLDPARSRSRRLWNALPGGLLVLPEFSTHLGDFPFYYLHHGYSPSKKFTAFIRAVSQAGSLSQPLLRLIQAVSGSQYCAQIVVLWSCEKPPPPRGKWPQSSVPMTIIQGRRKLSDRFFPFGAIQTDAVLSLDEDTSLSTSEVDFAFSVWLSFPERIVGFPTRSHFWDAERGRWGCTSRWTNEVSMVLGAAAFYHRYYHSLFTEHLPAGLRELPACQDVLLNALVAAVTKLPPIKVTQRKRHEEGAARQAGCGDDGAAGTPPGPPPAPAGARRTEGGRRLWQRQDCLNQLANWFGYMPLVSSRLRLDPVLFKDQVSVLRKKYPSLERP